MVQSNFSLSWDSYKSSICNGFSALQQNGEFVDMTIAADGHLVKVHQVLVALASPYLKNLISSAPCQHPVIFLNNVSHRVLCLLLEYIYTGEVVVPADYLSTFAEAAKSLYIRGLENIGSTDNLPVTMSVSMPQLDDTKMCHVSGIKSLTTDNMGQIGLPAAARKIYIKQDPSTISKQASNTSVSREDMHDYQDMDSGAQDSDDGFKHEIDTAKTTDKIITKEQSTNLQFTVSIRGSLQVILNRYIYNLHSSTARNGLRRWRCVDYRNNKCSAFVVTKGNVVLNRANLHNHSFHDKKILAKIEKNAVFSAIDEVQGYKEREESKISDMDISTEQDNYLTVEGFDDDKESDSKT